jgi:hypothetical protein
LWTFEHPPHRVAIRFKQQRTGSQRLSMSGRLRRHDTQRIAQLGGERRLALQLFGDAQHGTTGLSRQHRTERHQTAIERELWLDAFVAELPGALKQCVERRRGCSWPPRRHHHQRGSRRPKRKLDPLWVRHVGSLM